MGPKKFVAVLAVMQYILGVLVVVATGTVHPSPLHEGLEHDLVIGLLPLIKSSSLFRVHFCSMFII